MLRMLIFEFFLSKVVSDDKFLVKLTVTNRDCSDNLQETLKQLQSKVSKRNEGDLQQPRLTTTTIYHDPQAIPMGRLWNKLIVNKII